MSIKLSTVLNFFLFIGIFVFASAVYAPRAFASVIGQGSATIVSNGVQNLDNSTNQGFLSLPLVTSVFSGTVKFYKGIYPDASNEVYSRWGSPTATTLASPNGSSLEFMSSGINGDYWFDFENVSNGTGFAIPFSRIASVWSIGTIIFDTSTRIISFDPSGYTVNPSFFVSTTTYAYATATTTTVFFYNDVTDYYDQVCIELENQEAGMTLVPVCTDILASAESTWVQVWPNLAQGQYYAIVYFYRSGTGTKEIVEGYHFTNMYTNIPVSLSTLFQDTYGTTTGTSTNGLVSINGIPMENCSAIADLIPRTGCSILNGLKSVYNYFFSCGFDCSVRFNNTLTLLHDGVLSKVPIGYVTRIVTILNATTTTSLPDIVLHLPAGSPLAGTTTIFSTSSALATSSVLLTTTWKDDAGKNIWDYIMPFFTSLLYLGLVLMIASDLMKLDVHDDDVNSNNKNL